MHGDATRAARRWRRALSVVLVAGAVTAVSAGTTQAGPSQSGPKFTEAVAFDVSKPFRELAKRTGDGALPPASGKDTDSEPSAVTGGTNALFSPLAAITGSSALNMQAASCDPRADRELRGLSATRTTSTSSASASTRPTRSATWGRTTTSRWSTSSSPCTPRRARCCSGRSTPARCGQASRSRTARIPRATRSSSTTSLSIAGS